LTFHFTCSRIRTVHLSPKEFLLPNTSVSTWTIPANRHITQVIIISYQIDKRKAISMTNALIGLQEATGKIDYTFTNDYMFRAILQTNELVLKGLISALLHIPFDEIYSVRIENPIELGQAIESKDFILDIRVMLNNNTLINLEMQVGNEHNWTDRSLIYLCRSFDNLYKGQTYETVLPAIHIGILDFELFPDNPEFYASHKLLNIKSHKVFNDKFTLNVLCLKHIELATDEDKNWEIDAWAKLFATKTWGDIKMIAQNNEIFTSATQSLYTLNADDLIREQCQARADYERHERTVQRDLAESAKTIAEQKNTIAELKHTISEQENTIKSLVANSQKQQADYNELKQLVESLQKQIANND